MISPKNQTYSDEEALWQAFKQGDQAAFKQLYERHIHALIKYGYKLTANRALIQDCIQDLFVELWESRSRLANTNSVKFYLLKSVRYKLIRQLKDNMTDSLEETHSLSQDDSVEGLLFAQETLRERTQQLTQVLHQLPKRQREAIHLRFFQELSNEEVAEVMGVNYQSACKFIYTALKTLREKLQLSSIAPLLIGLASRFF